MPVPTGSQSRQGVMVSLPHEPWPSTSCTFVKVLSLSLATGTGYVFVCLPFLTHLPLPHKAVGSRPQPPGCLPITSDHVQAPAQALQLTQSRHSFHKSLHSTEVVSCWALLPPQITWFSHNSYSFSCQLFSLVSQKMNKTSPCVAAEKPDISSMDAVKAVILSRPSPPCPLSQPPVVWPQPSSCAE